jgi:hypothetical protein
MSKHPPSHDSKKQSKLTGFTSATRVISITDEVQSPTSAMSNKKAIPTNVNITNGQTNGDSRPRNTIPPLILPELGQISTSEVDPEQLEEFLDALEQNTLDKIERDKKRKLRKTKCHICGEFGHADQNCTVKKQKRDETD